MNRHRLGFVVRHALMLAACAAFLPAWAEEEADANKDPVTYLAPNYDEEGNFIGMEERTCTEYTLIKDNSTSLQLDDSSGGWYVVRPDKDVVKVEESINVTGKDVHIIICNKKKLICRNMFVPRWTTDGTNDLRKVSIYAQTANEAEMGVFKAGKTNSKDDEGIESERGYAGIGSSRSEDAGVIEINGCKVYATGGKYATGIGGGEEHTCSSIIINGGVIEARGGENGAGIGAGEAVPGERIPDVLGPIDQRTCGGYIEINGGKVEAWGKSLAAGIGGGKNTGCPAITINNGDIRAHGDYGGAGIGTGEQKRAAAFPFVFVTSIVINGGNVWADAGNASTWDEGAGIGGGVKTVVIGIVINGGTVTATGGKGGGAGIGGGLYGSAAGILITGGTVSAVARKDSHSAGIGGGGLASLAYASAGAAIAITGGKVYAHGSMYGAGIGGGDGDSDILPNVALAISISGSANVDAHGGDWGAGIGGGRKGPGSLISISGSNAVVKATGGWNGAAGIGGGYNADGEYISISGGKVHAVGGRLAAAIGGGCGCEGREIEILDGDIVAEGGSCQGDDLENGGGGAGIGGGDKRDGRAIKIMGGKVVAKGGTSSAGIGGGSDGDGSNIEISGGVVEAFGGVRSPQGHGGGAGIGGGNQGKGLAIKITDGKITAKGGPSGAGIGGGNNGCGKEIRISGGEVTAVGHGLGEQGTWSGAGIGGGCSERGEDIEISGGTVKASADAGGAGIGGGGPSKGYAKDIVISGGDVEATGGMYAAGIGGGDGRTATGLVDENIFIRGGTVKATGGHYAAGIGGGYAQSVRNVHVFGGTVTVTGGLYGAGIGGGHASSVVGLRIEGGEVAAQGGSGAAGIGGGNTSFVTDMSILGGTVVAKGGNGGAGVGGGIVGSCKQFLIAGGNVSATGGVNAAGIGGGLGVVVEDLQFSGGQVQATGGKDGSGIGVAKSGSANKIIFNGGTVRTRAVSASAFDIGGKDIKIFGGSIDALQIKDEPRNGSGKSLCKVVFTNVVDIPPVTVSGTPENYGSKDLYPDKDNSLYLWLPQSVGSVTNVVTVGTKNYRYVACGKTTYAQELSGLAPVRVNGKVYTELVRATDGCDFANGVLTIYGGKSNYVLQGTMTNSEVRVEVATSATVTLDNLWLESYVPSNSLIKVAKGATLNLKLKGVNVLWARPDRYAFTAANSCCGIEVPEGATLKIDSAVTGNAVRMLSVMPSGFAAGIGGNCGMRNGSIEIIEGDIGVLMGQERHNDFGCGAGAGIGAGAYANNGPIAIRGGSVTVERCRMWGVFAQDGACIGSGGVRIGGSSDGRAADAICVYGGTIQVVAGRGAGIGSGARNACVDVKISPAAFVTASADRGAGIGAGFEARGASVTIAKLAGETEGAAVGLVKTWSSNFAAGIGSGYFDDFSTTFSVKIAAGRVFAHGWCETNKAPRVAIGCGSTKTFKAATSVSISDGTVVADSIGRNDERESFADVVITGGSVTAAIVNGDKCLKNAVNGKGENVWPITVNGGWSDGSLIAIEGEWTNEIFAVFSPLEGEVIKNYGKSALYAVNGKLCLWGSYGTYEFTTTGGTPPKTYEWGAEVNNAPATAEREDDATVVVDGKETDWTESSTIPAPETTLTDKITWSAKNLPKGFKIDSKTGVISGYPTQPGIYAVRITAKSGSESETFDIEIGVGNLTDSTLSLEDVYENQVGVKTFIKLGDSFAGAKATGLPAGLKFAAKDTTDKDFGNIEAGTVYGVPTAACTNSVRFTKKEDGVTHTATAWFQVAAAPAWSVGTFYGVVDDTSGSATLTVAAKGKISGKIVTADNTWTFASVGYEQLDDASVNEQTIVATAKSGTQTATVTIVVTAEGAMGNIFGTIIDAELTFQREASSGPDAAERFGEFAGLYTVQLACDETGYGYLSLKLDVKGVCRATGKLPDGTAVSATLPVVWGVGTDAPVAIWYASPSAYKGGCVSGSLAWLRRDSASPAVIGEDIIWANYAPTATEEYGHGFSRILTANGAYYDKLATLGDYYDTLRFSADTPVLDVAVKNTYIDESTGAKTTVSEDKDINAAQLVCWSALTVSLEGIAGSSFAVDQDVTKPVQDRETKKWSYAGENDAALTLSFAKATGIFKGSFTCWYDYVSATDSTKEPVKETLVHAAKKVSYEGVMVLGESLRGFYLWNRTDTYEDESTGKEKIYSYQESRPVVFAEQQ